MPKIVRATADAMYRCRVIVPVKDAFGADAIERHERYVMAQNCSEATTMAAELFGAALDQVVAVRLVAEHVIRREDVKRLKRSNS